MTIPIEQLIAGVAFAGALVALVLALVARGRLQSGNFGKVALLLALVGIACAVYEAIEMFGSLVGARSVVGLVVAAVLMVSVIMLHKMVMEVA